MKRPEVQVRLILSLLGMLLFACGEGGYQLPSDPVVEADTTTTSSGGVAGIGGLESPSNDGREATSSAGGTGGVSVSSTEDSTSTTTTHAGGTGGSDGANTDSAGDTGGSDGANTDSADGTGGSDGANTDSADGTGGSDSGNTDSSGGTSSGSGGVSNTNPQVQLVTRESPPLVVDEDGGPAIAVLDGWDQAGLVPLTELSAVIETPPSHGVLNQVSGPIPLGATYLPNRDFFGSDSFTFHVADSDGHRSASAQVTIQVRPVNDAPVAMDDAEETDSVTPIAIEVLGNDRDPDNDTLTLVRVTEPNFGEARPLEDGRVLYIPSHPSTGTARFDYVVEDPDGASSTASVSIDVSEGVPVSIVRFAAQKSSINFGDSVRLEWETLAAKSCFLDGVELEVEPNGSIIVSPSQPTLYTLTCQGPGGPVNHTTLVVVRSLGDTDTDGDQLADALEEATGTDPRDSDSDDDGVPDGVEDSNHNGARDLGETDPLRPDSNDDGFCDGLRTDNDGDGLSPASDCVGPMLVDVSNNSQAQDGATWETAFSDLQWAVDRTARGREVWVAEGRYIASQPQLHVLSLPDGSRVYGGFAGDETYRSARNTDSRATILDGDFEGDDVEDMTLNRTDNSQRVVFADGSGLMDGFLVLNGHAQSTLGSRSGGGLVVRMPGFRVANAEFRRNFSHYNGGAISCSEDCSLTIVNTSFVNNQAVNGGAIAAYPNDNPLDLELSLSNVEFVNNRADTFGGAIYANAAIRLEANQAHFRSNAAVWGGGMLLLGTRASVLSATFESNSAVESGGGICNTGELEVQRTSLVTNTATYGGALYNSGALDARETSLVGNTATYGGALYSDDDTNLGDAYLTDLEVIDNQASEQGGGIYNEAVTMQLSDSSFARNSAGVVGGAIQQWGVQEDAGVSHLAVESSSFLDNTSDFGGAIRVVDTTLAVDGVDLAGNSAMLDGAAVLVRRGAATINDTNFDANTAGVESQQGRGAGLSCLESDCEVNRANFRGSTANFGGAVYCGQATCTLNQSTFSQNGSDYGGAVYCSTADCALNESTFSQNSSAIYGGAVYCEAATCALSESAFLQNKTSTSGGAIFHFGGELSAWRTLFFGNQAPFGGVALVTEKSTLSLQQVALVDNQTPPNASEGTTAGLHIGQDVTAEIREASFVENRGMRGGAVFNYRAPSVTLASASFTNNTATRAGGAFAQNQGSLATLTNVAFFENQAPRGGAIILDLSCSATLTNVSLLGNSATEGGAIYNVISAASTLRNSVFFDNQDTGGAPDVLDLGGLSSAEYTRSTQLFGGASNAQLTESPFLVQHRDPRLFLDPAFSGDAACVDSGSNSLADDGSFGFEVVGLPHWSALSTAANGSLDTANVDIGRHYHPEAPVLLAFEQLGPQLSWDTQHADSCWWFNDGDGALVAGAPMVNGLEHGLSVGTKVALVCFGMLGEPVVGTLTIQ